MPTPDEWTTLIAGATTTANSEPRPKATTPLRMWGTASRPVLVLADDEQLYVIKGVQVGRALFTDHVVARIGAKMGAPVGMPSIVIVSEDLIRAGGMLATFTQGPAHATCYIGPISKDRELSFAHQSYPDNRARFSLLAILYGWCAASDHQFLYGVPPLNPVVVSVDHGHFFGTSGWTVDSLAKVPTATSDTTIIGSCSLQPNEITDALPKLSLVTDAEIALAVASPPDVWQVPLAERVVVAEWLSSRRDHLLNG